MTGYTSGLGIEDVPWKRLISSYGRADGFPRLLDRIDSPDVTSALKAVDTLKDEMEHQGTLWPCTPFALVFLCRRIDEAVSMKKRLQPQVTDGVFDILEIITEACSHAFACEHAEALPHFSDMLREEYLLSDELQNSGNGFDIPDELFFSFYHYSFRLLKTAVPLCAKAGRTELKKKILLLDEMSG